MSRVLLAAALVLCGGLAEAQSFIRYHAPQMPKEVDCSDFFGDAYSCYLPPVTSLQRTVAVPANGTGYTPALRADFFIPTYSATASPRFVGWQQVAMPEGSGFSGQYTGYTGIDVEIYSRVTGTAIAPVEVLGFASSASTYTGAAYNVLKGGSFLASDALGTEAEVGGMFGVIGRVLFRSATALSTFSAAGSFSIQDGDDTTFGTDLSKVYKIHTDGPGRNYFMQPAATNGDTLYSVEAVGGKGIYVSGRTGQLQLAKASGGAKPTCEAATRGSFWYEAGGAGVADTVEVCRKDASNNYAWVSVI